MFPTCKRPVVVSTQVRAYLHTSPTGIGHSLSASPAQGKLVSVCIPSQHLSSKATVRNIPYPTWLETMQDTQTFDRNTRASVISHPLVASPWEQSYLSFYILPLSQPILSECLSFLFDFPVLIFMGTSGIHNQVYLMPIEGNSSKSDFLHVTSGDSIFIIRKDE